MSGAELQSTAAQTRQAMLWLHSSSSSSKEVEQHAEEAPVLSGDKPSVRMMLPHAHSGGLQDDQVLLLSRLNVFKVFRRIGSGSYSRVYECDVDGSDSMRRVAVKVVSSPPVLADEAAVLQGLHHPHLVRLLRVIKANSPPVLAFELYPGGTLHQLLHSSKGVAEGLRIHQRLRAVWEAATAMEFIHSKRVIHRDIQPENILLMHPPVVGPSGIAMPPVVLGGFGLAMILPEGAEMMHPSLSPRFGSPIYQAPEVMLDLPYNTAADVYSFGIVLHEVCSGRVPYLQFNFPDRALMAKILQGLRPSRDLLPPGSLGEVISQVVAGGVDPEPSQRMSTPDFVAHIGAMLTG